MKNRILQAAIGFLVLITLLESARENAATGTGKSGKYASERKVQTFAGATRVTIDDFDPADKDAKAALLQLDNNEVSFSPFGEMQVTAVFYKPFPVKLTRLVVADPEKKDRHLFAVEVPKEFAEGLGKNSLKLVASAGTKSQPPGVRLLLVNQEGKVTDALELRSLGN